MSGLRGLNVVVCGAGALGLAIAVRLAHAGAQVTVLDPAAQPSASAAAAGMLAPASEAVLDGAGPYALLREARDAWSGFAQALDLPIARDGALHLVAPAQAPVRLSAFEAVGARAEILSAAALAGSAPALRTEGLAGVFTPDDWRIDPLGTLAALHAAAVQAGARFWPAAVTFVDGELRAGDAPVRADAVILAAGAESRALSAVVPELARLEPIKGQLLRLKDGPRTGPVIRAEGAYLAPDASGVLVGATMEHGVDDTAPDVQALERLRAAAARVAPDLAQAAYEGRVGVRVSTPDGLPLVGRASRPGVWLATGARRNGWLFAPLVAEMLAAYLAGDDPGPYARLLDPSRFDAQR